MEDKNKDDSNNSHMTTNESPPHSHENIDVDPSKADETLLVVSRYGRTHKPKITEDFLPTDKKVGVILGLSPKKNSLPGSSENQLLKSSPNKVREKARLIFDSLNGREPKMPRGRKPKLKILPKASGSEQINGLTIAENTANEPVAESLNSDSYGVEPDAVKKEFVKSEVSSYGHVDSQNPVSANVSDNSTSVSQSVSDCGWNPGDVAWARIGGHPFWPCLIVVDSRVGGFTKMKRVGRGLNIVHQSLHVQFFGDNGRHSWVSSNCVIRYEGREGLEKFAEKVLSEIKKKDKKFSTAFIIKPSSRQQWECAVREADEALPKTRQERMKYFAELFPLEANDHTESGQGNDSENQKDDTQKSQRFVKKRKRTDSDTDYKPLKQIKIEPNISSEKASSESVARATVSQAENTLRRRRRIKKKGYKKNTSTAYEAFCQQFAHHVVADKPDHTPEEVQQVLFLMWDDMNDDEKAKFGARCPIQHVKAEPESSSSEEENKDNEDDAAPTDDDVSNSTRESSPSNARVSLKKASALFRGTRWEKVCQICLKPGNTVKCKGLCLGVFHLNCIRNPPLKIKEEIFEPETKRGRKRGSKVAKRNNDKDSSSRSDTPEDSEGSIEKKSSSDREEERSSTVDDSEFRCKDCSENKTPACFVCGCIKDPKTKSETRIRCSTSYCGKYYHAECLKAWPQASSTCGPSKSKARTGKENNGNKVLTCPHHVCHTCASDDPRNATVRFNHDRLVRCIQCPTAYHTGNYCVPAGSEILTGTQIICPRHYEPSPKGNHHINASWCFICAMVIHSNAGGSLICCDLCPTSFHAECLHIAPPEDGYICEDCDTGRYPLYGEVVWVKLGAYRWWPAQILFPNQIPDNIENLPHLRGEFAVKFFGSHDYYWVNRGRVFLYQEGDTGHRSTRKTSVDGVFENALAEACEAHKKMKLERSLREAEARPGMKPPSYIRIKCNKPVGNVRVYEADPSSMTPCECDPESDNPCGFDTDCLNRILLVECTPGVCAAGDRCGNQCFVKRLYPPLEPFKTESRGWGLRALQDLRKGQFVIEYVGEMIDDPEYQRRLALKHRDKDENYYFLTIDKDRLLDAGPKGNVARFMNHSCQPNCETQKWTVNGDTRVGLFALEDIPMGSELTFNYNLVCEGSDKKPCMCGAPNCTSFIGAKATKQPTEDEKKNKQEQRLIKRKKRKLVVQKLSDEICFICGLGGELVICDNKTCPRAYHLNCIKRRSTPQGNWHCPWHQCDVCKRRTAKRCSFCQSSFCVKHAEGNIIMHETEGMVCRVHKRMLDKKEDKSKPKEKVLLDKGSSLNKEESPKEASVTKMKVQESTASAVKDTEKTKSSLEEASVTKVKVHETTASAVKDTETTKLFNHISSINTDSKLKTNKTDDQVGHEVPLKEKVNVLPSKLEVKSSIPVGNTPLNGERRKRGRPRKYPLGSTPISHKMNAVNSTSVSHSQNKPPQEGIENNIKTSEQNMTKSNEPVITPRSSKRKRQPSAKITAYLNSRPGKKLVSVLGRNCFPANDKEPKSSSIDNTPNSDSPEMHHSVSKSFNLTSYKRTPKKTILQRVDHKPNLKTISSASNRFSSAKKILTLLPLEKDKYTHSLTTPYASGKEDIKGDLNVTTRIMEVTEFDSSLKSRCSNTIFESVDDAVSLGTESFKCPEYVHGKDEFLTKVDRAASKDVTLEIHGNVNEATLPTALLPLQTEERSEKISEDGKYQILTNVCPQTLVNMESSGALLLHVGS